MASSCHMAGIMGSLQADTAASPQGDGWLTGTGQCGESIHFLGYYAAS
jgi:hypothetical protein